MSPLSDVTVAVTGGDGPGLRSIADPCNPLLIPDTGSILRVNTLSYTFCIISDEISDKVFYCLVFLAI